MRKPAKFTEADVARALKAAQKAKISVACVRIEPDGTILIIPGTPEPVAGSAPNPWDE
jgi:hypothetical protein